MVPLDTSPWPWHVFIQKPDLFNTMVWNHFCSGTIVGQTKILSAAHCLRDLSLHDTPVKIVAGVASLSQPAEGIVAERRVVNVVLHPRFTGNRHYDVAVLDLEAPLDFSDRRVQPVCLPRTAGTGRLDKAEEEGLSLAVAGWGERSGITDRLRTTVAVVYSEARDRP